MIPRVTLFCGQTQSGKSTLALFMAIHEWPRVIVLDSARSRVFDRIAAGGHFSTALELVGWMKGEGSTLPRWAIALRSKNPEDYGKVLHWSEFFRGILIVCDETHKLCRIPGVREPLELVALTGAHYGGGMGVSLYMVTQRATGVPINVRSQAERVVSFKQREPADVKWLAERCGEDFAQRVTQLGEHNWLQWPEKEKEHGDGPEGKEKSSHRGSGGAGSGVVDSTMAKEETSGSASETGSTDNASGDASSSGGGSGNPSSSGNAADGHD